MIIITIEIDVNALEVLKETCRRIAPDAIVMGFGTSEEALEFAHTSVFDMAFFDVDGEEVPFAAAQNLMECAPSAGVVLISSDEGKALEAFNIHASGFIMKPFSEENIRKEYEHYMESLNMSGDHEKKLRVRTFGNFEVFADGMPMKFRYQKTKEMLAYLIDRRGAMCSNGELISALWGDDASNRVSYLKNLKTDLMTALEDAGFHDVVVKQRGLIGITLGRSRRLRRRFRRRFLHGDCLQRSEEQAGEPGRLIEQTFLHPDMRHHIGVFLCWLT